MFKLNKSVLLFIVCIFLAAMPLSGCHDAIELENRGFISAISIDKNPDEAEKPFMVGAEMMALNPENENNKGNEDGKGRFIVREAGEAFTTAMRLLNVHFSKSLHYGLTKACLLGEELLKDGDLLRQAADGLERNGEISRKLLILAAPGDGADLLSKEIRGESSLGFFVTKSYRNNENFAATSLILDLENFLKSFLENGGAIIPCLKYSEEGKELLFSGAAVIAGGSLAGYLSDDEMKGLLWLKGKARGAQVFCETSRAPLRVNASKVKLTFSKEGGKLICLAAIKAEGTVEEYAAFNSPDAKMDTDIVAALEKEFGQSIEKEIGAAWSAFIKYNADGFGLSECLRKRYPDLYAEYSDALHEDLVIVDLKTEVTVRITNTGAIK